MSEKQSKIDIPESIESYSVTLFWGLTMKQIILVFIATLFIGLGIFNLVSGKFFTTLIMLIFTTLVLLAMVEVRGRNFYRYLLFILNYYRSKPNVLIYNHFAASGIATIKAKELVYQKESNTRLFLVMFLGITIGIATLLLIALYIYHVIHK